MKHNLIEFIGLPGSGKSTTSAALVSMLKEGGTTPLTREDIKSDIFSGYASHSIARKAAFMSRAALADPALFLHCFHFAFSTGVGFGRSFAGDRLLVTLLMYGLLTRRAAQIPSPSIAVLDEALIHRLWCSVVEKRTPPKSLMQSLLSAGYHKSSALIVYIDASAELAAKRVIDRPTMLSNFDRMPLSAVHNHLMRASEALLEIVDAVESAGIRLMRISALNKPDDNARLLLETLA